jgi:hypothetical protein
MIRPTMHYCQLMGRCSDEIKERTRLIDQNQLKEFFYRDSDRKNCALDERSISTNKMVLERSNLIVYRFSGEYLVVIYLRWVGFQRSPNLSLMIS